jgi:hypothetical protein
MQREAMMMFKFSKKSSSFADANGGGDLMRAVIKRAIVVLSIVASGNDPSAHLRVSSVVVGKLKFSCQLLASFFLPRFLDVDTSSSNAATGKAVAFRDTLNKHDCYILMLFAHAQELSLHSFLVANSSRAWLRHVSIDAACVDCRRLAVRRVVKETSTDPLNTLRRRDRSEQVIGSVFGNPRHDVVRPLSRSATILIVELSWVPYLTYPDTL